MYRCSVESIGRDREQARTQSESQHATLKWADRTRHTQKRNGMRRYKTLACRNVTACAVTRHWRARAWACVARARAQTHGTQLPCRRRGKQRRQQRRGGRHPRQAGEGTPPLARARGSEATGARAQRGRRESRRRRYAGRAAAQGTRKTGVAAAEGERQCRPRRRGRLLTRRRSPRTRCSHRARCSCRPASCSDGRIGRSRRHNLQTEHTEGSRKDARAAKGLVRWVEAAAKAGDVEVFEAGSSTAA